MSLFIYIWNLIKSYIYINLNTDWKMTTYVNQWKNVKPNYMNVEQMVVLDLKEISLIIFTKKESFFVSFE